METLCFRIEAKQLKQPEKTKKKNEKNEKNEKNRKNRKSGKNMRIFPSSHYTTQLIGEFVHDLANWNILNKFTVNFTVVQGG
jgi:hypothetical protein